MGEWPRGNWHRKQRSDVILPLMERQRRSDVIVEREKICAQIE